MKQGIKTIQNLYEDKVNGTLTEERFIKLSKNYENEQADLTNKLKILTDESEVFPLSALCSVL